MVVYIEWQFIYFFLSIANFALLFLRIGTKVYVHILYHFIHSNKYTTVLPLDFATVF